MSSFDDEHRRGLIATKETTPAEEALLSSSVVIGAGSTIRGRKAPLHEKATKDARSTSESNGHRASARYEGVDEADIEPELYFPSFARRGRPGEAVERGRSPLQRPLTSFTTPTKATKKKSGHRKRAHRPSAGAESSNDDLSLDYEIFILDDEQTGGERQHAPESPSSVGASRLGSPGQASVLAPLYKVAPPLHARRTSEQLAASDLDMIWDDDEDTSRSEQEDSPLTDDEDECRAAALSPKTHHHHDQLLPAPTSPERKASLPQGTNMLMYSIAQRRRTDADPVSPSATGTKSSSDHGEAAGAMAISFPTAQRRREERVAHMPPVWDERWRLQAFALPQSLKGHRSNRPRSSTGPPAVADSALVHAQMVERASQIRRRWSCKEKSTREVQV